MHAASDYECYGLADKELQIFRKFSGYRNLEELRQTLTEAIDEKYNDLLKDFSIELTVLKDQIKINTGVSHTRLGNLVSGVEDILDSVRWRDNVPDLESEESAAQRRNQPGWGLRISTPNQMLSRLSISLAHLQEGNNSEKLKNEIIQLFYSFTDQKNLHKTFIKNWLTLFETWKQLLWTAKIVKQVNHTDLYWI